ncbi:hypothetical protein BX666DRAFT_1865936 [Dichotomocladium elegans]|nr:hypothetical protein BX666DRAFT_1865936 [Dichotomocladium elegans]
MEAEGIDRCNEQPQNLRGNSGLVLVGTLLGQKHHYICDRIVLQDFCYKFQDTKDSIKMSVYETASFVFVSVMQKDKLSLWQLKRGTSNPRLLSQPFTRFNDYWIPQEPRWVSFADDRSTLRFILAVFPAEATAIGIKNSKVHAVPVDKLTALYQSTSRRLQYESNAAAAAAAAASSHTISQSVSFPELPIDTTLAAMEWTSLIQLPFYPTIQPSTLTEDYSIPPTYNTVVTSSPHMAADPVALTSTASPQLFFATLGRQSYIIDLSGRLFTTQVYVWTHEPQHIEFIELDDWCVVGFSRNCVELLRLKTAEQVHRIMNGVAISYLGRWESDTKSKVARAVCWSCTTPQDVTQIYMLQPRSQV